MQQRSNFSRLRRAMFSVTPRQLASMARRPCPSLRNQTRHTRHLSAFLQLCSDNRFVVFLLKYTLYNKRIKWCGRLIDSTDVLMDRANYMGLKGATEPTTGVQLCEYIHRMVWMSMAIPRLAERDPSLIPIFEEKCRRAGWRTKKAIAQLSVADLRWSVK